MALGHDQHRVEGIHRRVAQVGGDIQHRADRQVHGVRAQQAQAVLAGHVVQHQLHRGMGGAEGLHQGRQQVEDGRAAGRHVQVAAFQPLEPVAELPLDAVYALHKGSGQFVQGRAAAGQRQAPAQALEQGRAHVTFQGLQLQGHCRLAEEQGFGGPRYRAQPGHLAEGAQGLEPVALVVEPGFRACHRVSGVYIFDLLIHSIETFALSNSSARFTVKPWTTPTFPQAKPPTPIPFRASNWPPPRSLVRPSC